MGGGGSNPRLPGPLIWGNLTGNPTVPRHPPTSQQRTSPHPKGPRKTMAKEEVPRQGRFHIATSIGSPSVFPCQSRGFSPAALPRRESLMGHKFLRHHRHPCLPALPSRRPRAMWDTECVSAAEDAAIPSPPPPLSRHHGRVSLGVELFERRGNVRSRGKDTAAPHRLPAIGEGSAVS